jgi:hypothetical protein
MKTKRLLKLTLLDIERERKAFFQTLKSEKKAPRVVYER